MRQQRAQLKRDLKAGRCSIDGLLTEPPVFVLNAKVADLLLALPKYGPVKVNKLLKQCRIAPTKTLGGLTPRQRHELAALVAEQARTRTSAGRRPQPNTWRVDSHAGRGSSTNSRAAK